MALTNTQVRQAFAIVGQAMREAGILPPERADEREEREDLVAAAREERDAYGADMDDLESVDDWAQSEVFRLRGTLAGSEQARLATEQSLAEMKDAYSQQDGELAAVKRELAGARAEAQTEHRMRLDAHGEVRTLRTMNVRLSAGVNALQAQQDELNRRLAALQEVAARHDQARAILNGEEEADVR
jgi:chromosome segregation ATPase